MAPKILIVDDDDDVRLILASVLAPVGEILEASGSSQALRALKTEKPALMLLDVSMPGADGLSVLKAAHALDPDLPVVMITAECGLKVAKGALEQGASAYVTKPFDAERLREDVSRLLGQDPPEAPYRPWRVEE